MDKILLILFLIFLFSCREEKEKSLQSENANKDTTIKKPLYKNNPLSERPLYNWQLLDTANRENIFEDTVPVFLEEFARKNEFPCPDTVTGCAACGYFAYERQETKHYCEIKIYGKTRSGIIALDTLYGTVINALPIKGSLVYQLTLLEAYWEDDRPMNVEFYQFEKEKFILTDSIIGQW